MDEYPLCFFTIFLIRYCVVKKKRSGRSAHNLVSSLQKLVAAVLIQNKLMLKRKIGKGIRLRTQN